MKDLKVRYDRIFGQSSGLDRDMRMFLTQHADLKATHRIHRFETYTRQNEESILYITPIAIVPRDCVVPAPLLKWEYVYNMGMPCVMLYIRILRDDLIPLLVYFGDIKPRTTATSVPEKPPDER